MNQSQTAELSLDRPMSARRGYGQVIRQTVPPRELEYRVLNEITQEMEAASVGGSIGQRGEALGRNRELWQALGCSAADDGNALPPNTRAAIISLSIWVTGEVSRVLRRNGPMDDLIEVNRSIMRGLLPAPDGAATCP